MKKWRSLGPRPAGWKGIAGSGFERPRGTGPAASLVKFPGGVATTVTGPAGPFRRSGAAPDRVPGRGRHRGA